MDVETSSLRAPRSNPESHRFSGLLRRFAPRNDGISIIALLCATLAGLSSAHAADKIRAGKAISVIWAMVPLDIGVKEGLFAKYGVDVDITTMSGGAKLQQGLVKYQNRNLD